jgi:hypothetical protein
MKMFSDKFKRKKARCCVLKLTSSVADPDRFGSDPDPTSEDRPDPVKTGSKFI